MSAKSLRNTLAFRSDYDFRTVFKLLHYCGVNLDCCIKTREYFTLTIKKKISNGQLWKIWKETVLIELCSFFIDILPFELGKLCPGVGILFRFSTQGPEFCTEKLSPGSGF